MWTIQQGHALDLLKQMPSNTVHVIVSSPPYWGLRDYGLEPSIWDGAPDCPHNWESEHVEREMRTGMNLAASAASTRGGAKKIAKTPNQSFTHSTCQLCGAWRGQLGLEPTPELFIKHMVEICREARRVLRGDGSFYMNMGDGYGAAGKRNDKTEQLKNKRRAKSKDYATEAFAGYDGWDRSVGTAIGDIKPKDLIGMPWMLALALRADGWYLRSDIIWEKLNPMPESVTDRPARCHEYIFLLTKSTKYYYDRFAVQEPSAAATYGRMKRGVGVHKYTTGAPGQKPHGMQQPRLNVKYLHRNPLLRGTGGGLHPERDCGKEFQTVMRNRRTVWHIATQSFKGAHFATYPVKLVEPCILAGSSERGCCSTCAAPWVRKVAPSPEYQQYLGRSVHNHGDDLGKGMMQGKHEDYKSVNASYLTVGWRPSCKHYDDWYKGMPRTKSTKKLYRQNLLNSWWKRTRARCLPDSVPTVPATVLDIFCGSGTTLLTAQSLGRDSIGLELSEKYIEIAGERIANYQPPKAPSKKKVIKFAEHLPLFDEQTA